jgi:hypothetical protein
MSSLHANYAGLPVQEAVPGAIDMSDMKVSSILQGRRRIRFQPQTGVSAGPQSIVQFVLSDSTGLMDVNSMVLSFAPRITSAPVIAVSDDDNVCCFDDGPSMIRRVQVLANGSLVEDIDQAHRCANIEILSNAGKEWYAHDGSFMNYWRLNETLTTKFSADSNPDAYAQNAATAHGYGRTFDLSGNGYQMEIPMGLIAPSLRSQKYWPLRNMGELVLQITTAAATEAIFNLAGGTPSYVLNDIYLEVDIVTPHPQFAALLDRMCQLQSESGLVIPVETKLASSGQSVQSQGSAGSALTLTESNIVTSRATTNLRRVDLAVQPTAGINAFNYPSVSNFPDEGFSSVQWRVGSLYFPQQPANSLARAFAMTAAAYGEVGNTDRSAVFNSHNYDSTTLATNGAVYVNRPNASGQFDGELDAAGTLRYAYADFAPKSYCFDAYKGGEVLDADGISVLGQAGSQIVNILRMANPETVTPLVALVATKYLVIKDGGLRVQGA